MKVIYKNSITEKVIIVIGILLVLYISYVTIDSFRLYHKSSETKPLITISVTEYETENEIGTKYMGLGYSVKYYKKVLYKRRCVWGEYTEP